MAARVTADGSVPRSLREASGEDACMSSINRRSMMFGGAAVLGAGAFDAHAARSITRSANVLASSDLSYVLPEILRGFETDGAAIGTAYSTSTEFDRRLREAAPPDLVLGADEKPFLALAASGLLADAGVPLAEGRLALVVNRRSPLADDISLGAIAEAARNDVPFRVVFANPDSTPYGGCANDVLERWSVDQLLRPRFVYTEDVTEAVRLVSTGQIAVGLVPKSLTTAPAVARTLQAVDIPHGWHRPLVQRMALSRGASAEAQRLYAYLKTEAPQRLLARFGYGVPGFE